MYTLLKVVQPYIIRRFDLNRLKLKVTFICSGRKYDDDQCIAFMPLGIRVVKFNNWDEVQQYISKQFCADIECKIFDVQPVEATAIEIIQEELNEKKRTQKN